MPKYAVSEDVVDLVLPPKLIAEELTKLSLQLENYHLALSELNQEQFFDRDKTW